LQLHVVKGYPKIEPLLATKRVGILLSWELPRADGQKNT